MSLTVDALLAAEDSSDEEETPAAKPPAPPPSAAPQPAAPAQPESPLPKPEEARTGASSAPAPAASAAPSPPTAPAAPSPVKEKAPRSDSSDSEKEAASRKPKPNKAAMTVEDLLAGGGDLTDSDEDMEPTPKVSVSAGAGTSASVSAPADSEGADRSTVQTASSNAEKPKESGAQMSLEALLAGSDSSDEDDSPKTKKSVNSKVKAPAPEEEEKEDPKKFLQDPWDWCHEHESRVLLVNPEMSNESELQGDKGTDVSSAAFPQIFQQQMLPEVKDMLQQEAGLPTCVATHPRLLGIGTLRGGVVLVDPKSQEVPVPRKPALMPPSQTEASAVTAVAFSGDGSSILVGHKNGQLVLWDLATQKCIQVVKDAHTSAVVSVVFWRPNRQYALSSDVSGCVLLLTFTSVFGVHKCERQLLLERSSKIGVTLRMLPLPPITGNAGGPLTGTDAHCLVALCSTNAIVLLTLHPQVQLLHKMQYQSKDIARHASWLPDAAWVRRAEPTPQEMQGGPASPQPKQQAESKGQGKAGAKTYHDDARLCVAFGLSIHLLSMGFQSEPGKKEAFKIQPLQKFSWSAPIHCLIGFSEGMFAILDAAGKLSLVQLPYLEDKDTGTDKRSAGGAGGPPEIQTIHSEDVTAWNLSYHTHTSFDGTEDAKSHHSAIAVVGIRSRQLYVCGMKDVRRLVLGRWGTRIEDLVNRNQWTTALNILLALHNGSLPPLLDFPFQMDKRQAAVGSRANQFVQSYLVNGMQADAGKEQLQRVCSTAVDACIRMGLWSVLYKTVFESFKSAGLMNIYCGCLESFIVRGQIPAMRMDSEVLSSILQSYTQNIEEEEMEVAKRFKNHETGQMELPWYMDCDHHPSLFPTARRLQRFVLSVDVSQLDLNLAIRLFTQHRLWTALVYVYSSLRDYVSPLELLVGECARLVKAGLVLPPEEQHKIPTPHPGEAPIMHCQLVRKLFFFLARCFESRPFPFDQRVGPGMVSLVLLGPGPSAIPDLLRRILQREGSGRAPQLFLRLLRLSPLGLFNGLALLYTSPSGSHAVQSYGKNEENGESVLGDMFGPLSLDSLFEAVDSAVDACIAQAEEEGQPLPPNTENAFLMFVARAVTKARLSLPGGLFKRVVDHLLAKPPADAIPAPFEQSSNDETQQLLIGVLSSEQDLGPERRENFVQRAVAQSFFSVASWLHEEYGEYDKALDCRLRDQTLREGIFEYIICRLAEECENPDRSSALVEGTLQRLPRLVAVDAERAAAMVCEQFANLTSHDAVLGRLNGYPEIEMQYLDRLLIQDRSGHWKSQDERQRFYDDHVVRYVELLCQLQPVEVLPFLKDNETLPLRECLDLCRQNYVTDAAAYLLERTGDFGAVLELLLGDYEQVLMKLHRVFIDPSPKEKDAVSKCVRRLTKEKTGNDDEETEEWWDGLDEARRCVETLESADQMSGRNSQLMTPVQLEELWMGFLGHTVKSQEKLAETREGGSKRRNGLAAALEELITRVMAGVIAYLSLPQALQRICTEWGSSTLAVLRAPLARMLSGLAFQQGLLRAAKAIAAQDVVKPFCAIKAKGSRAVSVDPDAVSWPAGAEMKLFLGVTDFKSSRRNEDS